MKIAFVISCIESKCGGLGGHYQSLAMTVTELSKHHDVFVVVIGTEDVKTLDKLDLNVYSVLSRRFSYFSTLKRIKRIIDEESPDVVHAFDDLAFLWVRSISDICRIPCCVTKCGGRNPIYWPKTSNLVLYSKENFDFFSSSAKFRNTNLLLLPHRIRKFDVDEARSQEMVHSINADHVYSRRILRIARIGPFYQRTAEQLIALVEKLRNDGVDCCGILLGTVESTETLRHLKNLASMHVYFFTDQFFSRDAKGLLDVADVVVGTGRSLMEAAALGKVVLCPVEDSELPLLIDEVSFSQAFEFNFSERTRMGNIGAESNYQKILDAMQRDEKYEQLSDMSQQFFEEHFDVAQIQVRLSEYYDNLRPTGRWFSIDWALHVLFVLRKYLQ